MSTKVYLQGRTRAIAIEGALGAFLICGLGFALQWRYGFNWADEGLLWYASQRTALGDVPIRDFFSYDPGRYYWNSVFFHVFDDAGLFTLLLAGAAFGAVGLAAIWIALGRAGLHWTLRVACAILIAIALGFPRHKVYEQSLSLILVAIVFFVLCDPGRARRWFTFGMVAGLAAFVGRNHGVFFVFAAVVCATYVILSRQPEQRSALVSLAWPFASGVIVGYLPMLVLLLFAPGFWGAFVSSVLSTANWQLPLPIPFVWKLDFGRALSIEFVQQIAIGIACILIPVIYLYGLVVSLWNMTRSRRREPILVLIAASSTAGVAYLHQAFDRADFGHIAQATLPVFPAVFALGYYHWSVLEHKVRSGFIVGVSCAVLLASWLPSEPVIRYSRMQSDQPGRVIEISIGGREFLVEKNQADLLMAVERAMDVCDVGPNEFLAAPHFPGVYAYLNAKAPFWEMYYLYPRSKKFQEAHLEAIANTRLMLLAPEATVDGLERLKLKNTYPLLMKHINRHYQLLESGELSYGARLYVPLGACQANKS